MPVIRPISDLRNKTPEIERICRKSGEPVFSTKNGENDLVVLSAAAYERDQARLKLYELLAAGASAVRKGDRGVSLTTLAAVLRTARRGSARFGFFAGPRSLSSRYR